MVKRAASTKPAGLPPAAFHVLVGLADGPRHGYAIKQELERLSRGRVRLGPGTLYEAIQRLEAQGLIEAAQRASDGDVHERARRPYRLTRVGIATLKAELARLEAVLEWARDARLLAVRGEP
jgi:DNA-binding PadR family transcriptional regulator